MSKIILINNDSIEVKIDESVLDGLDVLDRYDVKELFEYAEDATTRDEIIELIDDNRFGYAEDSISLYDVDVWNEVSSLGYRDFIYLESEYSDIGLDECGSVLEYFRYLLISQKDDEIYDDLCYVYNNMEIVDLNADEDVELFEYDELSEMTQQFIRDELNREFEFNWSDLNEWTAYYNNYVLSNKHCIFKNLELGDFRLDGCQSDSISLVGEIKMCDLKILIKEYKEDIYDYLSKWGSFIYQKDRAFEIFDTILSLDNDYYAEIIPNYDYSIRPNVYLKDNYDLDAELDDRYEIEDIIKWIIFIIEVDLKSDASNNLEEFIESDFEGYLEMYTSEYLFTIDGEPVERY